MKGTAVGDSLRRLETDVVACYQCPRLVAFRAHVARQKKPEFRHWEYWGRPVPGFGDPQARVLLLGLAPAAHGANRTGRMFTGDLPNGASVWLVRSLYGAGFANRPTSVYRQNGLELRDVYLTAAVRCAPPQNRPSPEELRRCLPFLVREFLLLPQVRVVVALGGVAFRTALALLAHLGVQLPRPKPRFVHGALYHLPGEVARRPIPWLLCSYHPSRQNTQTGKLTASMLDTILCRAKQLAEESP